MIWLDEIIEVQKGLAWVKHSSENKYRTSTNWSKNLQIRDAGPDSKISRDNCVVEHVDIDGKPLRQYRGAVIVNKGT